MREGGVLFLALKNQTRKERVGVDKPTVAGKAVLTNFVLNSVSFEVNIEATKLAVDLVNKVHGELKLNLYDTRSEFSSFAQNFLSSWLCLSEIKKRKRTDPQMLKPIQGPNLSSVLSFFLGGGKAKEKLTIS